MSESSFGKGGEAGIKPPPLPEMARSKTPDFSASTQSDEIELGDEDIIDVTEKTAPRTNNPFKKLLSILSTASQEALAEKNVEGWDREEKRAQKKVEKWAQDGELVWVYSEAHGNGWQQGKIKRFTPREALVRYALPLGGYAEVVVGTLQLVRWQDGSSKRKKGDPVVNTINL